MVLIDAIGVTAGLCGIAGFAPQISKILRERETHAISAKMYGLMTAGFGLWVIFGLAERNWPIAAANAVMLSMAGVILLLKFRFK